MSQEQVQVDIPATYVYIGNVSNGYVSAEFTRCLVNMVVEDTRQGWGFWRGALWTRSGVNISERRNNVIRDFLKTDGEWLLLLDSDMIFPTDVIPRLLFAAMQTNSKAVGGLCVVIDDQLGPRPTLYHLDQSYNSYLRAQLDYPEGALLQVAGTGAACLMVHREVLEAIRTMSLDNRKWLDDVKDDHPIIKDMSQRGLINPPSEEYAWFAEHPVVQRIMSSDGKQEAIKEHWIGEDLAFCMRIGAAGYPIFVDCGLHIGHHKEDRIWWPSDIKEGTGYRQPEIVAVIPVKDRLDLTAGLVNQIREQGKCQEIIVCDNGSGPATKEWLSNQDDVTTLDCPDIGINAMWNKATEYVLDNYSHKTHIAFLNNDLIIGDEFLNRLSLALFRNPEMVAVCGNYDGRVYSDEIQEVKDICANRYDGTGGFAGFAFMVRSEWLASGYRFPDKCMWWYGDNHLMQAIEIGNQTTKDIARKAGIVIGAHVEHIGGGGGTAGDVMWSDFSEQLEKDRIEYEKFWADYGREQFKQAFEYLCQAGTDISEHLPTFLELVLKSEAQTVIELGVRTGVSTIAWLYGLSFTGGHLYSVDIDPAPAGINHENWHFIRGDDLDPRTLEQLPDNADIVFIDTDHRYELTQAEIKEYSQRVVPGGYVVFHDINVKQFDHHVLGSQPLYPVRKAVLEWVEAEDLSITTYENCYGLAIVKLPDV
jgi:predicted O-methyltransferase YrrM/GT2 family glycosyltransferase